MLITLVGSSVPTWLLVSRVWQSVWLCVCIPLLVLNSHVITSIYTVL